MQSVIKPRDLSSTFADVRLQLNDQLRCLDSRLEAQQGQLVELQDIFRRRAEIELNYSRDLEKLGKLVTSRHKEQKTKREVNNISSNIIFMSSSSLIDNTS